MTDELDIDFPAPLPSWAKHIAVFDLETTGLDLTEARIVTACAVELDASGSVVEQSNLAGEHALKTTEWLANPGIEIPTQASDVHGVTTAIAIRDGRPAKEVVTEIIAALNGFFDRGLPVVAYNAPFDFSILYFEALRHGLEPVRIGAVIDPLVIDKFKDKYRKGKRRLENAAEFYKVPLADAHNATADAVAAGRVAQAIALRWSTELPDSAKELHNLQIGWSEVLDADFESYMKKNVNPDFTSQRGWPLKI